jgi:hypothetical protein
MHKEGEPIVENAVEARAGFLDRPVFFVLLASSVLVIALLGAAYLLA